MEPALMVPPESDHRWTLARQLGVDSAVVRFWGHEEWWDFDTLLRTRSRLEDYGLSFDVVEDRPPMEKTVRGREGRDEEIAAVKQLLRNTGNSTSTSTAGCGPRIPSESCGLPTLSRIGAARSSPVTTTR